MQISLRPLLLVAALLPIAGTACAQSDSSGGGRRGGGSVTLDQFLQRQTGRIMAADTDGDGKVSKAEFMAQMNRGGRGDPSRMFDAMDSNHDGFLDQDEIKAGLTQRFQRMDSNHDGVVTPDERMAAMRAMRGGGGQPEGGATPNP